MNKKIKQFAILGLVGLSIAASAPVVQAHEVETTTPTSQMQETNARYTGYITSSSFQIGHSYWTTEYRGLKPGYTYSTKAVIRYSRNGKSYSNTVLNRTWTQSNRDYHGFSNPTLPSTMGGTIRSGDKMDVYLYYNGVTISKQTFSAK